MDYDALPMFHVLNADGARGEKAAWNAIAHDPVLVIGSTQDAISTFDDDVEARAKQLGCAPLVSDDGRLVFFADWDAETGEAPDDLIQRFEQAGVALVKLPDRLGDRYYRWYVLAPVE